MPVILGGGYSFVTNNRRDFRRLFGAVDGHAGLVIIIPSRKREGQVALFNLALDRMESGGANVADLLIEVHGDGRVTVERYPFEG